MSSNYRLTAAHFRLSLMSFAAILIGGCNASNDFDSSDTAPPEAEIAFPGYVGTTEAAQVLITGHATDKNQITLVRVNGIDATTEDGYANWRVTVPLQPGANELVVETADQFSNRDLAAAMLIITSGLGLSTPDASNPFSVPVDITLDADNNRALVVDAGLKAVLAVNLTTGERTIISDPNTPDTSNPFESPGGISLDAANNRALVTDTDLAAVVAVDLSTGIRTILSDAITPDASNPLEGPSDITLDAGNNRLLVTDYGTNIFGSGGLDAVVAVDLTTGARTILSDSSTPNASNPFEVPIGITLDAERNRALVVDVDSGALLTVDLTTGARTILSDSSTPNSNNVLTQPWKITLDADNNRALVVNQDPSQLSMQPSDITGVMAVDLTTGVRTILSGLGTPDANNPFVSPLGITMDAVNNRALITDNFINAVVAVELTSGERVVISR